MALKVWAGSSAWLEDHASDRNVALTRQRSPVQIRSGPPFDEPTTVSNSTYSGQIAVHALWMQKEGYRRSTILSAVCCLKSVARKANLLDPESVKRYLGAVQQSEGRKEAVVIRVARLYRQKGITWTQPRYHRVDRLPWIPTEQEVNLLIGGMGKKTATFLQLLKETGVRPGEAWALTWKDIDPEKRTVTVTPEKNSNPRCLKLTEQALSMIDRLKKGPYIFHETKSDPIIGLLYFRRGYERRRKHLAERLQNPRLQLISFKTLRHYKATMEYHKTKDILHVMQLLGHKNIRNTLVYTHLVNWESDGFVSKVAIDQKEITELIENGFEFVLQKDGLAYFRKRK